MDSPVQSGMETWPLDRIKPYGKNPRKNDAAVEFVANSIKRYGPRNPILVDPNGVIIAGHTRRKAAAKLGMRDFPVVVCRDMSAEQIKEYRLADNKTGEKAEWDIDLLRDEVGGIEDVDLLGMGFERDELDDIFGIETKPDERDADVDPSKADELLKKWKVQPGDLWAIGEHRLLCGDSTRAEDVTRVMGGKKACCVFTDPPYGVSVGAKNRLLNSVQPSGRCLTNIEDDDLKPEELEARLLPAFVNARTIAMADDCTVFMTAPQGGELSMMMMMMQKAGLKIRHVLIWKKNAPTFSMGRLDYDYQHEPILLTWGKRHKRPMKGTHKTSVWEIDKPRASADHPTMKPVELYVNGYLNNSDDGDTVYEPYSGSGTAFIAAQQISRTCHGIEISPGYCSVILERMSVAFPELKIDPVLPITNNAL